MYALSSKVPRIGAVAFAAGLALIPSAAYAARATSVAYIQCGDTAGLIAAIDAANKAGSGTIALARGCVYNITGPSDTPGTNGPDGLPVITGNIAIYGDNTTITRNSSMLFRIVEVATNGTLLLKGITVSGGYSPVSGTPAAATNGGGILNFGTLRLVDSAVYHNHASGEGGGIEGAPGSSTTLSGSLVQSNHAADLGGGIHNNSGTLSADHTSFIDNVAGNGGGAVATFGPTTLQVDFFSGNTAVAADGGAVLTANGTSTVTDSSFRYNRATAANGGGIANEGTGTLIVQRSSFRFDAAGTDGGGVYNFAATTPAATATISDSVITEDEAGTDGGGVYNGGGGTVTMVRDTVQDNTPDNCGGTLTC